MSITEIIEEVKEQICDDYCRYPREREWDEEESCENEICAACPLNRL